MVLTAFRGGLGFLTRLPVGRDEQAWNAFRTTPVAFPLVGYVVGLLLVLPLAAPLPELTAAAVFVLWVYLVTGINHTDGLADLGDALVVHGNRSDRQAVMQDTMVGVGGVLSVVIATFGLGLAGVALAGAPLEALGVVVAAEVSAKLGMAALACFGTAAHGGFGEAVTAEASPRSVMMPAVVAVPVALSTWPRPAGAVALCAGLLAGGVVLWSARRILGGVNGDVLGASNEIARVVALHAGVIAWMHS